MTSYCKRCREQKEVILEKGKPKTRMFRSGFVACFLSCGHTTSVNNIKHKEDRIDYFKVWQERGYV